MTRLKPFKLKIEEVCPCGETDLPLKYCCLEQDGRLRKKPQIVLPPSPETGHSQAGCYLAASCNCSKGLSAEHYMSRNLLEIIGDGKAVSIRGAPWQTTKEPTEVGINSLTAKILCERHNSALANLDAVAGKFFKKLLEIFKNLEKKSLSRKNSFVLMSGEDVELWMLKVACGLYYSNMASRDGNRLLKDHSLDHTLIIDAFNNMQWKNKCGLYVREGLGHEFKAENSVAMAPVSVYATKAVIGAEVRISGLSFMLLFDPNGWGNKLPEHDGWGFRPSELLFRNNMRSHSIGLTWKDQTTPRSIQMDLIKRYRFPNS